MVSIDGFDGIVHHVGQHLGHSDWSEIDQERINEFAHATGDMQWIHTDSARAARESPYGSTIAHGFLTLSLIPALQHQIFRIRGIRMGVNYGANKVRFPAPVPVGARVRVGTTLQAAELIGDDAMQVSWEFVVEIADGKKPACIAELVFRYYR